MKTNVELKQDVITELNREQLMTAEVIFPDDNPQIEVTAEDGVVILGGEVDAYAKKWTAYLAARRVADVVEVIDNIKVKLPGSFKLSDEEIYKNAVRAISLNVSLPHDRIKVRVQDASITLIGEVDRGYQRVAAARAVRYLKGVAWVSNEITIHPMLKQVDMKSEIELVFQRNFTFNSAQYNQKMTPVM
jgi:osmotically-inducible protein OsmY